MTAADRPSDTDNARAEAERHYPALNADDEALTYPRSAVREHARGGFVKGYEAGWAAGRAETTTDCGGCRGLGKHSPRCHTQPGYLWRRRADRAESLADEIGANDAGMANRLYAVAGECRARAETTTATTEDKSVIERAATVITANTDEPMWSAVVIAKEMASRGLLATARTRPTREQVIDALVMSPLSDTAGTDMRPFERTADAVLALLADQPDPADVWDQGYAAGKNDLRDGTPFRTFNPYRGGAR